MYQSIQFAYDGDYIIDHNADTIEAVWEMVNDQGSKWYFYPFPFVVKSGFDFNRSRIIDAPDFPYLDTLKGLTIKHASEQIKDNADLLEDLLNTR